MNSLSRLSVLAPSIRHLRRRLRVAAVLTLLAAPMVHGTIATAGVVKGPAPVFSTAEGAIRGYDPVAYFTEGRPIKGRRDLRFRWREADWHFASEENRARFQADPERYAPRYGGYCAFAMSKGSYAETDPAAWTIHEGRLYLNYSLSIRDRWSRDIPGNVARADRNWRRLGQRR